MQMHGNDLGFQAQKRTFRQFWHQHFPLICICNVSLQKSSAGTVCAGEDECRSMRCTLLFKIKSFCRNCMISCYDCRLHIEYHTFVFKKHFSTCAKIIPFAQAAPTHTYTHKFLYVMYLFMKNFFSCIFHFWFVADTADHRISRCLFLSSKLC